MKINEIILNKDDKPQIIKLEMTWKELVFVADILGNEEPEDLDDMFPNGAEIGERICDNANSVAKQYYGTHVYAVANKMEMD